MPTDKAAEQLAGTRNFMPPGLRLGDEVLTDQKKYYSAEIARQEWNSLWTRVWTIAGRVSDVASPGDYFRYELGGESFVIVRSTDDRIRAFYNVCQHRGSRFDLGEFGNAAKFVCPFHSWAWNIDGTLKRITDIETFPPKTVCDRPNLSEVRCETWGGFVFICMDDRAPPLTEFLGTLAAALAPYGIEEMIVAKDYSADWPTNWKIGLDAFMEGYHAHARHPELIRMIDDYNFEYEVFGNGHSRMIIPMTAKSPRLKDPSALTAEFCLSLQAVGLDPREFEGRLQDARPAMIEGKRRWMERFGMDPSAFSETQIIDDANYNVFPNITFNAHPEGVLVMRFRPHATDPNRCHYDVWVLTRTCDAPGFAMPFYMAVPEGTDLSGKGPRPARRHIKHGEEGMGLVLDQDAEFLPTVQAGVQSRGFRGIRLSHQELRLRYYYEEYNRHLRA
ncbi:MAG: aromatic ring-hydroxylating dioxygenase subunit alpha [Nevskia sp.]|nr:aromatic ring-hydroxylating dioxygenase subunit alpha [Nevskia sp.]